MFRDPLGLGGRPCVIPKHLQIMALFYLLAYPDAMNAELCSYIQTLDPLLVGVVRPHHVSRFSSKFKMSWKAIRSVAHEKSEMACLRFWQDPLPRGVNGVHFSRLVDTDESFVYVTTCNRKRARTFIGRVYFLCSM